MDRNSSGDTPDKKVGEFKDQDTPLRNGEMNFNNLVGEKPGPKTNLDMYRGSIHEAMPGAFMPPVS
jgi:hypothetical protein